MNALLISDLHLTDHPRDAYRWGLFEWLHVAMPKHGVDELFILGDLTEAKDYHSSKLVNRIVDALLALYRKTKCHKIYVLRGNHDGIDPTCAYFRFLGQFPSIQFVETPLQAVFGGGKEVLLLPHTRTPEDWQHTDMDKADYVFMHATIKGSIAENGQVMEGAPPSLLLPARRAKIYSGDIHVPQKVGPVEYVGAPYPIRFGDKFQGRAVLLENWRKAVSLPVPSPGRHFMDITPSAESFALPEAAKAGDQVKARIHLQEHEYGDWQILKRKVSDYCKEHTLELCGLELVRTKPQASLLRRRAAPAPEQAVAAVSAPTDVYARYCVDNSVGVALAAAGKRILDDALGGATWQKSGASKAI